LDLIFTTIALFAVMIAASIIFYRRIKLAQQEYEDSKNTVRNITFGFTRLTRRLERSIESIGKEVSQAQLIATEAFKASSEAKEATLKGLEGVKQLKGKVDSNEETLETMKKEIHKLATRPRVVVPRPELDAPIPVQEQDVLSQLTDTELEVLEMIVDVGEGTVPEIRAAINKTREHTARLLKKLYDKGYVDRNTSGMPYRYSIRKEIRDLILQRKEQSVNL